MIAPVVRHRSAIVEPVPLGALLRAIDGYDGTPEVRSALQLLALTFTRPGELRLAAWGEFNLDAGVWTIPARRMKMRRPHRVPLAPQTIATLEDLRTLTGQFELLFPGVRSPSRPLSAYARAEYWAERVEMMAYWADRLDELRRSGIVVPSRA